MKMIIFGLIACFAILSCNKEDSFAELNKNDLVGIWVNLSNTIDSVKIDDSKISRIDTVQKQYLHYYSYFIDDNSIVIKYTGLEEILVEPSKIKVTLNENKSEITFEGLTKYHPKYFGETFKKIK